jgi:hypothetical protein
MGDKSLYENEEALDAGYRHSQQGRDQPACVPGLDQPNARLRTESGLALASINWHR